MLAEAIPDAAERPRVAGKFLYVGDEKLWVKGVTYGTFRPMEDGTAFPEREVVRRDFAMMATCGINSIRTYTPPPRWLLDLAQQTGLRVMVGLAWEQHVTFLDDTALTNDIEDRIRAGIHTCLGHPAILCYAIGNEIPPSIVRWHGRKKIERFLRNLYELAKRIDPGALVTYVNFPTTEYLQLPFLDFQCFNVYLESREALAKYLARLHNLALDRPVLMAEIGLDSRRNGERAQAESLDWQIRTAFAEGCAGTFVFAWTDEWYRGGFPIDDWDFGLTTRHRTRKPALAAVETTYAELPFATGRNWPKVSVVVCSFNGASTIRDTLEGLKRLAYPSFEVIVINDGSTDATPTIAGEYDVKLFSTENRGLSNARNLGWQHASGEIVAYIDDDAYPDPHWLHYIAHTFQTTDFVGVGGPNIAPPGDGPIADCVWNAPGGPVAVLLTDREAEHIPGCNMAFRRDSLAAIGGFDPRFRTAGDDVDVCWRLQDNGGKIGFHAAAMVWHHRRNSLRMYWNQQRGYGKAEALLEEKWPEKYNAMGHFSWSGRLYGRGLLEALDFSRSRIYGGSWGSALFQSLHRPDTGLLASLPLMPEWDLAIGILCVLTLLGLSWSPLFWTAPLLVVAVAARLAQALIASSKADFPTPWSATADRVKLRAITTLLHLVQPMARLIGRLRHGLTPWRSRGGGWDSLEWSSRLALWCESWQSPMAVLEILSNELRQAGIPARAGGDTDDWDLEIRGGLLGYARLKMAAEEHGSGKQQFKFRIDSRMAPWGLGFALVSGLIAVLSALDGAWMACLPTAFLGLSLLTLGMRGSSLAVGRTRSAVEKLEEACFRPGA